MDIKSLSTIADASSYSNDVPDMNERNGFMQ